MKRHSTRTVQRTCIPRAFTLVELLVVMAIIAVLIALLIPVLSWVRSRAKRVAIQQNIQTIALGIDTYFSDFSMYPLSVNENIATIDPFSPYISLDSGGKLLAEELLGYLDYYSPPSDHTKLGDGAGPSNPNDIREPMFGFRAKFTVDTSGNKVATGRVYGPYVPAKFFDASSGYLCDLNTGSGGIGGRIFYYRSTRLPVAFVATKVTPNRVFGAISDPDDLYFFRATDNPVPAPSLSPNTAVTNKDLSGFRALLGVAGGSNTLQAGDNIPLGASYLLVSPGLDGVYFNGDDIVNESNK